MSKFTVVLVSIVVVVLALPLVMSARPGKDAAVGASGPDAEVVTPNTAPEPVTPPPVVPSVGPALVWSVPANGATNVDPRLGEIRVTFDREMGGGFSWTGGGDNYPQTTGKPFWSADRKTCILPVALRPNWSYRFGLNSPSHRNFKSIDGQAFTPTVFTFSTGPG